LKKSSKKLSLAAGWVAAGVKLHASGAAARAFTMPAPKTTYNKSFLLLFFKKEALSSGAAA
jgi:hypothetical protein